MPRITKKAPTKDVLEVVHHEIPDTAAGAGAEPIPAPPPAPETGMTWRRLLSAVAVTEVVGLAALLVATTVYGVDFFMPAFIAAVLFGAGALWMRRRSRASTIFTLVVASVAFLFLGVMFFSFTGFLHLRSWFEVTFATLTVLVPLTGIVAATKVLRHRDGADAARTPAIVVGAVSAALVLAGVIGSATASDATRRLGDVTVGAHNVDFDQTAITAKSGDVAIYFENKDPFPHNMTIDGHGTTGDAAGRQSIRHVFHNLAPGTYAFYCSIHKDDMKGTLTVT
jgi:plastocyanin